MTVDDDWFQVRAVYVSGNLSSVLRRSTLMLSLWRNTMKKKLLGMLLSGAVILSMVGCGSQPGTTVTQTNLNTWSDGAVEAESSEKPSEAEEAVEEDAGGIPVFISTVDGLLVGHQQIQYVDITTDYDDSIIRGIQSGECAYYPDIYKLVDTVEIGDVSIPVEDFFCNPADIWQTLYKVAEVYDIEQEYWSAEEYDGLAEDEFVPAEKIISETYGAGSSEGVYRVHCAPSRDGNKDYYYFYIPFREKVEGEENLYELTDEFGWTITTEKDNPDKVLGYSFVYPMPEHDTHCLLHTRDDRYILFPYVVECADTEFNYDLLK